jgi:hypothetical protein
VALGEGDHGNIQSHEFRLKLIHDPRFLARVDDIVVEFGNAKYQDLVDRYVSGDTVPLEQLRLAWRDTSQASPVWDPPIYEDFFRAVRDVNRASGSKQLRILLGDPPITWDQIESFADISRQMRKVGDRDTHPAILISGEVQNKRHRVLVVYGGVHLQRTPTALKRPCDSAAAIPCFPGSIVDQLLAAGIGAFNIHTLTAASDDVVLRLKSATVSGLIHLRDESIGELPYREFASSLPPVLGADGRPQPDAPIRAIPLKEVFDGLLYLGSPASMTYSKLSPEVCADPGYVAMRRRRMALVAPPNAARPTLCGKH